MIVGAMNNPAKPLAEEVRRIAAAGFDFIDVTLEPPGAWPVTGRQLRLMLRSAQLPAVGHTAYYLPLAAPFPQVRKRALDIFERMIHVFGDAGIELVNVHPGTAPRLIKSSDVRKWNAEGIAVLTRKAAVLGLQVMVENLPVAYTKPDDFQAIFATAPDARFHLDIGHTNIGSGGGASDRCSNLLTALGDRLVHVHAHDNLGSQDLHLPIGAGTTNWKVAVRSLKASGYDGTVTVEVFSPYEQLVQQSRKIWLELWQEGDADGGSVTKAT